jgi:hypothetical protein
MMTPLSNSFNCIRKYRFTLVGNGHLKIFIAEFLFPVSVSVSIHGPRLLDLSLTCFVPSCTSSPLTGSRILCLPTYF